MTDLTGTTSLGRVETASGCGCGGCGCGAASEVPRLDVRTLPKAVRHAAVHGALDSLAAGEALVLLAPHEPRPLLDELEQRRPGAFLVSIDAAGPETWAVRLTRST